jgi:MFS transporter, ACS family, glucarate transporter
VRWFLVFWLLVLGAVSYLDRVNISIVGESIVDTYHVQNGKIFSALVAVYALFQTPIRECVRRRLCD